jgi:hypothetical protein
VGVGTEANEMAYVLCCRNCFFNIVYCWGKFQPLIDCYYYYNYYYCYYYYCYFILTCPELKCHVSSTTKSTITLSILILCILFGRQKTRPAQPDMNATHIPLHKQVSCLWFARNHVGADYSLLRLTARPHKQHHDLTTRMALYVPSAVVIKPQSNKSPVNRN